jgi:DNA topoisomerase IB
MRLRRSNFEKPGISRQRRGKGFSYSLPDGRRVEDAETLARIRALAVPPAWTDVWICPWPNGHIQAVGTDAAGRRQYRYHDQWRVHRDREKFERVLDFAAVLPEVRAVVTRDLAQKGLGRDRVLAAVVRLLDVGLFRVGGEEYARDHETFGVTSLHREHVRIRHGALVFRYSAKDSKERFIEIRDDDVRPVIDSLRRRRSGGPHLFAYKEDGEWIEVRAHDANAYIKAAAGGEEFSAKDFRTWSATVLAAAALAENGAAADGGKQTRKRAVVSAIAEAADYLGDTPAVARSAYVDPRVIDRFEHGETIADWLSRLPHLDELSATGTRQRGRLRRTVEQAVIDLINDAPNSTNSAGAPKAGTPKASRRKAGAA